MSGPVYACFDGGSKPGQRVSLTIEGILVADPADGRAVIRAESFTRNTPAEVDLTRFTFATGSRPDVLIADLDGGPWSSLPPVPPRAAQ